MSRTTLSARCLAIALVSLACLGCGGRKEKPRLPVFPVTGRVSVDGKPAGGVDIYFHPTQVIEGMMTSPLTRTKADGTFAAGTYAEGDGLPVGEYALTAQWPTRTVFEGEEVTGEDQLKGRYTNTKQPITKITVSGQLEVPPLELKSF